jgi:RNA-directed DNA polymerase
MDSYGYEGWGYWLRDLIHQVALHDPRPGAAMRSTPALFARVPRHKSLRHAPEGKGLPIGNLTSQFFANLYMNELDQHVKHVLKARHYGRYVDDMVLFHEDPGVLNGWYTQMNEFLMSRLGLHLPPCKKHLNRADTGIDFLASSSSRAARICGRRACPAASAKSGRGSARGRRSIRRHWKKFLKASTAIWAC